MIQKQAAVGFEPTNNGFANRRPKNVKQVNTKTCETTKEQLTPQLTPKSKKQAQNQVTDLPSDLAQLVEVWSILPEHIKAAIKALVQTHNMEVK